MPIGTFINRLMILIIFSLVIALNHQPLAVVDTVGHYTYISRVLPAEYTFYPIQDDIAGALRQAREGGAGTILFAWVFPDLDPAVYAELEACHNAGIEVFMAAGWADKHTAGSYRDVATIVSAVDSRGRQIPGLYYGSEVEVLAYGCQEGDSECSTSLATARAVN